MDDLPTPDPAEQERRERIPSLQGDTPLVTRSDADRHARHQSRLRRNRTITTTFLEGDGSYTVTFRYLTNSEAIQTLAISEDVRPLSRQAKRDLWALIHTPHRLKPRHQKRGRKANITPESAPLWVDRIRQAVAAAGVSPPTYETACEAMRPSALGPDQFGKYIRRLAALGYAPWPDFFEKHE